ncbi:DUF3626 domain-containing protein [Photobacterium satsumensis]|uniref:DUF3626 domain-containing protein n=1 Tax=Photobacterium satsumensis TaxID=2910239 RepID=UPI003D0C7CF7
MNLTAAQLNAVHYVNEYAQLINTNELQAFEHILNMSNISQHQVSQFLAKIQQEAQIAAHFHPDRITGNGLTVVESMLSTGQYLNQFESLVSNGKLDPNQGGERATWENHLFGDVFTSKPLHQRPKYGALDIAQHSDGPCPRFGSCYFVFKSEVSQRATLCFGDSHLSPKNRGTAEVFKPLLAAILLESFERDSVLGLSNTRPKQFVDSFIKGELSSTCEQYDHRLIKPRARNLDHYIEAQVHGDISLSDDVESLVADASFKGTDIGEKLGKLCERYGISLFWRPAYRLAADNVPDDFRGPAMVQLARSIAIQGEVTACAIGQAARDVVKNASSRSENETQSQLQQLKLLWHVLVKFG